MPTEDHPAILKDSVQVDAFTLNEYRKNYDIWSWVPRTQYRVNGPITSGSQLSVEFTLPGTGPWLKFDCKTGQIPKGSSWKTECGGPEIPEDKGSTYTGPVNFAIRLRNELAGMDVTLFTGKMKVAKVHSNESGPRAVNRFVYYVDQDWNLPIGYIFVTRDDVSERDLSHFNAAFWIRGEATNFQPHLFYQGQEIGKIFYDNVESGAPGCTAEVEAGPTLSIDNSLPQKAKWTRVRCDFPNVFGWNRTAERSSPLPGQVGTTHKLNTNPGDYELKVLVNNHLARSIKFTVSPDGKFDNGIAAANKLGSERVIVPVQIIGDVDGQWDHAAWKTEAFYGNPLAGFAASP